MEALIGLFLVAAVLFVVAVWLLLKSRNMEIWIVSYAKTALNRKKTPEHRHVYFCLADHYEPYFGGADQTKARALVDRWVTQYRIIAANHSDSEGKPPQHSYFYPEEEYDPYVMDSLASICKEGLGDVDIHLHHDNDTAENLESTLNNFKQTLYDKHQLLRRDESGDIVYGFIHGNWALANSRPDGRWCGVDNEIEVLLKTKCVYDMTMPSAPSDTQTSTINSIYFAKEKGCRKSHNTGVPVTSNNWNNEDLLMIQGPLMLNWKSRKAGLIPRIEAGELSADAPPTEDRLRLWENANIVVSGQEEHLFIKVYTHGLQEKNMKMFFDDGGFDRLWTSLENRFKSQPNYTLHYVNAWQMYSKIKQLAGGT